MSSWDITEEELNKYIKENFYKQLRDYLSGVSGISSSFIEDRNNYDPEKVSVIKITYPKAKINVSLKNKIPIVETKYLDEDTEKSSCKCGLEENHDGECTAFQRYIDKFDYNEYFYCAEVQTVIKTFMNIRDRFK